MPDPAPHWKRHIIYRTECTRLTWKARLALVASVAATVALTNGWWIGAIGRSLVCEQSREPSDAILIENFDPDYLLFERARELRRAGLAERVLVPIRSHGDHNVPSDVALGIADVMAGISRVGTFEVVPIKEIEPISLNAARDIRRFLLNHGVRSIIVVTPLFRSRRSARVYEVMLAPSGVAVRCEPVEGALDASEWTRTWHGFQVVAEQWLKLQYYRLYVLPFRPDEATPAPD